MQKQRRLYKKILAAILVFCLVLSDFAGIGITIISYASDNQVDVNKNIMFDMFISTDKLKEQKEITTETTDETIILTARVGIKESGYLKSPVLDIENLENQMFKIKGEIQTGEYIQSVNKNKIYLNQINNGVEIEVNIPIEYKKSKEIDVSKIISDINLVLSGTYVDSQGNASEIAEKNSVKLGWKNETSVSLLSKVEKYVPYVKNNVNCAILQLKVETALSKGTESFPIKDTSLSVKIPQIAQATISDVSVDAVNTGITNGLQGGDVIFTKENWNYENGMVNINVSNIPVENIYKSPEGKDEYIVTVVYENIKLPENKKLAGEVALSSNVFKAGGVSNISGTNNTEYDLSKQTGSIVTYSVTGQSESLSKGNIYANYNLNKNYYETEYSNLLSINVSRAEIVDTVNVREKDEYFKDTKGKKISTTSQNGYETYYKQTRIGKKNLDSIIGENGNVQILDENNKVLVKIDKDTETDEKGNIIVNYPSGVASKIIIQVNNPEGEGILNVENIKAIGKLSYSKQAAINIESLTSEFVATAVYNKSATADLGVTSTGVKLTGTKSNATLHLSRNELSTLVVNKDVEISLSLNNYNEHTDLYKNPVFELTFPNEVKKVDVKKMNILYGNEELKIDKAESFKNSNGNIVIRILVKGTQTRYSLGEVTSGTTIILNSDITLDKYVTSKTKAIKLNYYNESATAYENQVDWNMNINKSEGTLLQNCGELNTVLKIVAPEGVLNIEEISGYDDSNKSIYSIDQGEVPATINTYAEAKIATMKITMMNNTKDVMKDVSILGRTAFKGNKSILSNEDLGTTVDATMLSGLNEISNSGKKTRIYYSENPEATKDLNNNENGWKESVESYKDIKSYLIVVENDVEVGDIISYNYKYNIPAKLSTNNAIVATMSTNCKIKDIENKTEASKVILKTVEEPILSVETTSDATDEIKEGQIITYTVTVKNDGRAEAKDIKVTSKIEEGTTYIEKQESGEYLLKKGIKELNLNIGVVEAGKSKSVSYKVKVDENATEEIEKPDSIEDSNQKLLSTSKVEAEGLEKPIFTQAKEANVKKAEAEVSISEEDYVSVIKANEKIQLNILVNAMTDIENAKVKVKLPQGISFVEAYTLKFKEDGLTTEKVQCASYDKATHSVIYSVNKITGAKYFNLIVKADKVNENGKEVIFKANVSGDNISEYESNEWIHKLARPELNVEYSSSVSDKYIKEKTKVVYTLKIKNVGMCSTDKMTLSTNIPKKLNITSAVFEAKGQKSNLFVSKDKNISTDVGMEAGDTAKIILTCEAASTNKEEKVDSVWTLRSNELGTIYSDKISQIVQTSGRKTSNSVKETNKKVTVQSTTNTVNTPSTRDEKSYRITGMAWNDKDGNGRKDPSEQGIQSVLVKLYSASTNKQISKATTDASGEYTFSGLTNGSYYIVYGYNTSKYKLTTYHEKGVNTSSNSDAILTNSLAITDKITIAGASQGDIDIGLVESKIFDLSLDKTISKITVQNNAGVKAYTYNNVNTAKVDIKAKQLASSKVYIEYKITVSNKGELKGYAKKIVDYIQKGSGMIFSQDLNPGWYQDSKGYLYSEALSKTAIEAGQSASVKLVLVKQMTESNTGVYNNTAEIAESFNESAIEDIDSVAGNGIATEDDMGQADVIISVNTGGGIVNIMLLISTLITLFIVLYIVKVRIDINNKGVITWGE